MGSVGKRLVWTVFSIVALGVARGFGGFEGLADGGPSAELVDSVVE